MTNILKYVGVATAGIVVGLLFSVVAGGRSPSAGGVYNQVTNVFPQGIVNGDRGTFFQSGIIGPGVNQTAYTNVTGKILLISAGDVNMGWTSGTASSSGVFYVSTSTSAAAVSDFSRPAMSYMLIDGATFATSTVAAGSLLTGTSTAPGKGGIMLQPGESLIFNYQERFACKTNGPCETATSTGRGIPSFFWNFKATYLYQ